MRREDRLTSLPSKMSFLIPAGISREDGVALISGIPAGGGPRTETATVSRRATTGCTSRTPTLAWTSEAAVDNVVPMEWSWATAEYINCRDACWMLYPSATGSGKTSLKSLAFLVVAG